MGIVRVGAWQSPAKAGRSKTYPKRLIESILHCKSQLRGVSKMTPNASMPCACLDMEDIGIGENSPVGIAASLSDIMTVTEKAGQMSGKFAFPPI